MLTKISYETSVELHTSIAIERTLKTLLVMIINSLLKGIVTNARPMKLKKCVNKRKYFKFVDFSAISSAVGASSGTIYPY